MRLIVVIASAGRSDTLERTLYHLERQERLPDEVVISASSRADVPPLAGLSLNVRAMLGPKGLCAQRNTALVDVLGRADIVTFFDDDFLPASTYLFRLERAFETNPKFSVIHGYVIADGNHNGGYTFNQGLELLRDAEEAPAAPMRVRSHVGAYGCNMSVRAAHVGDARFDERLVLYGWQEDIDFTARVGRRGRIVSLSNLLGVHLGVKAGRLPGIRFGYSQIVNPVYLVCKGTMPPPFAAKIVMRNVIANVVRSLRPEPWVDRRGRLRGNIIAISHVVRGRLEPEYVMRL